MACVWDVQGSEMEGLKRKALHAGTHDHQDPDLPQYSSCSYMAIPGHTCSHPKQSTLMELHNAVVTCHGFMRLLLHALALAEPGMHTPWQYLPAWQASCTQSNPRPAP